MILRKPYKFLIKNFKLIHLIMTILMIYVVYKYNFVLSFFNEVLRDYTGIISSDATSKLYNIYFYLVILLIIIFSLVLIGLLYFKKKPIKLYIVNIAIYIVVIILFAYSYSVVGDMQLRIIDPKIIRNVRDFLFLGFCIQVIPIILFTIRAIGFDIKKFNFVEDLKEFDINNEDDEEFELRINVDVNKAQRKLNKGKRYFGYFYKENRYLFFIISSISVAILSLVIYLSMGVYNKKYTQNEHFKTSEFMMSINNAYLTNKDYRGNVISKNKTLIVLELEIKKSISKEIQLNLARTELVVGNNKYYHNNLYRDKLIDIGNSYQDELISNDFTKYLLVYEIPNELLSNNIEFRYVDKNADVTKLEAKTIRININTRNLDQNKKTKEYSLGDTINFKDSILGNTEFVLNDYLISKKINLEYQYCSRYQCYNSIEILTPSIVNNYDKVLMKLYGNIAWDNSIASSKKTDMFKFLSIFGTFKYTINGEEKTDITTLKNVVSKRKKEENIYYIELIDEMIDAEKIDLIINVRDYTYIYHIK